MEYCVIKEGVLVYLEDFSLQDTLECGQCFRFSKQEEDCYFGIASNHCLTISQRGDSILFHNISEQEFLSFWMDYFDLTTDYAQIKTLFASDPILQEACEEAGGIRILRQDGFETLCSFILSANNNIPRIKGIVQRLCTCFGERLERDFAFPSAQRLALCSEEDLAPIRSGFRARYLLDAARKTVSGEFSPQELSVIDIAQARESLYQILGVGKKVAECVLLYGFHRLEAFPVDVWIHKVLSRYYPDGFPFANSPYAGIAQQYLFHYFRMHPQLLLEQDCQIQRL